MRGAAVESQMPAVTLPATVSAGPVSGQAAAAWPAAWLSASQHCEGRAHAADQVRDHRPNPSGVAPGLGGPAPLLSVCTTGEQGRPAPPAPAGRQAGPAGDAITW